MEFRRSGGRDERRRRVLRDEPLAEQTSSEKEASAQTDKQAGRPAADYSKDAIATRQPRISDLVPRSPWLVAGFSLISLLAAGAIVSAAWYSPNWQWLQGPSAKIFAAGEAGNLASWFASLIMLLCAAGSLQIYWMRRHKIDDYRGRYRLWGWIAAALVIASADQVAGLRHLAGSAFGLVLPESWGIQANLLVIAPLALMVAGIMIRLAIETRRSRGTLAALSFAAICYTLGAVVAIRPELVATLGATDPRAVGVSALGLSLAGHFGLLLSTMLFARYVYLAANGMLKVRPAKPKRERQKAAVESADDASTSNEAAKQPVTKRSVAKRSVKVEAPAEVPAAQTKAPAKPAPTNTPDSDDSPATLSLEELADREDLTAADTAHLSKAEKRRLRKLQRRTKRAA